MMISKQPGTTLGMHEHQWPVKKRVGFKAINQPCHGLTGINRIQHNAL